MPQSNVYCGREHKHMRPEELTLTAAIVLTLIAIAAILSLGMLVTGVMTWLLSIL